MKKALLFSVFLIAMASSNVLAEGGDNTTGPIAPDDQGGGGGYSCTVTSNCFMLSGGGISGTVSCTGTECVRGFGWVMCNKKITSC